MSQELSPEIRLVQAQNLARLLYIGHGACLFFSAGMLTLIPVIINYIKRPDTAGTFVESHHTWMIRTFWISLAMAALCFVLIFTIIGIPLAMLLGAGTWLWFAYRVVRGFLDLDNGKAMST